MTFGILLVTAIMGYAVWTRVRRTPEDSIW